jgi:serine/threonine protein phosphatase PrpC
VIGRVAAVTDPGRTRRHNEDSYVIEPPLFAIADGMGGAQAGEVASRLATAALKEGQADAGGEQRIADLIQEANRRVYDRSSSDPNTSGMGTTITVALVNELLKTGKLSREEAETHPQRSVITRALGTDPDVDVDTFSVRAENGDLFLLCSDGLTDMVSEESILDVVERHRADIEAALRALVKEANRGGGQDNITVVAFEIAGGVLARDGDTREQALPPPDDDEDTLSELDGVPTVDTAVVSVDEIQAEDKAVRRRRRRRRILAWLAILLLVAAVAVLLYLRFVR